MPSRNHFVIHKFFARSQVPPGNSIEPGATQLTRIRCGAKAAARFDEAIQADGLLVRIREVLQSGAREVDPAQRGRQGELQLRCGRRRDGDRRHGEPRRDQRGGATIPSRSPRMKYSFMKRSLIAASCRSKRKARFSKRPTTSSS